VSLTSPQPSQQPSSAVPTATKLVYFFDQGQGGWKDLLGGKGANLAEMTRLGHDHDRGVPRVLEYR
jgi:hypothetical protein